MVAKSDVPFTRLFTDQTLEQEIKMLKRHGGIVGLSQDDTALDRLVTTTPHLTVSLELKRRMNEANTINFWERFL